MHHRAARFGSYTQALTLQCELSQGIQAIAVIARHKMFCLTAGIVLLYASEAKAAPLKKNLCGTVLRSLYILYYHLVKEKSVRLWRVVLHFQERFLSSDKAGRDTEDKRHKDSSKRSNAF